MKKKYLIIILITLVLVFTVYGFTKIHYYPKALVIKSKHFIELLNKNDLITAYALTTKKGTYYDYRSPQLFKIAVERQAINFLRAKKIQIKYKSNYPYQTYGNRIRRWFSGRSLDIKRKNIDLRISVDEGLYADIGFEVRWELQSDKSWKIIFFQSHAY